MSSLNDQIQGNWKIIKGKIKQEFAHITDNDLRYIRGKEEELLGRLQRKMGKTKEEIKQWVDAI